MKKATDDIFNKYASKNALFKEIYDNQQAYMKKAREWSKMSEYKYIQTSEMVK